MYENLNFRATFRRNPSHETSAKFLKHWDTRKVPFMNFCKLGVVGSTRKVFIARLFFLTVYVLYRIKFFQFRGDGTTRMDKYVDVQ